MRRSKIIAPLISAVLAVGVCHLANAKPATTKKSGVHGVIESVQRTLSQITVKIGNAKQGNLATARIVIGPNTTIQLKNNKPGDFKGLHAGDRIIIEPDTDNPATIIDEGSRARRPRRAK